MVSPSPERGGTGIVMVMGLWNFLLLGSTVTMGLKVARLPRIFFTVSSGTGWAWEGRGNDESVSVCFVYSVSDRNK